MPYADSSSALVVHRSGLRVYRLNIIAFKYVGISSFIGVGTGSKSISPLCVPIKGSTALCSETKYLILLRKQRRKKPIQLSITYILFNRIFAGFFDVRRDGRSRSPDLPLVAETASVGQPIWGTNTAMLPCFKANSHKSKPLWQPAAPRASCFSISRPITLELR
jgi:hypothetical protein